MRRTIASRPSIPQRGFAPKLPRRDHERRQGPRRRGAARCRRRQFRHPCRYLGPPHRRLQDSVLSVSVAGRCRRPLVGRWQPNSAHKSNGGSIGGSYVFDRGFFGVADDDLRQPVSGAGTGGDRDQNPHRHEADKVTSKGEYRPDGLRRSRRSATGPARPITARRDRQRGRLRRRAAIFPQQPEGSCAAKSSSGRSICALPTLTTALGVQGRPSRISMRRASEGGTVRSQHHPQHRRLHVQRIPVQCDAAHAARRPHRAERGARASVPDLFVDENDNILRASAASRRRTARSASCRICRAIWSPAPPRNMSSARRARRNCCRAACMKRPAPSTSAIPICSTEVAKSVEVGLRRDKGPWRFEADRLLYPLRRLHLPQPDRPDLRRGFRKLRAGRCRRTETGGLFAARRDLPRRRIPDAI